MKRILSILLTSILIISMLPFNALRISATATTGFAGGSGTENDPYLIETKYHLNNIRNYPSAHFKMVADIEFKNYDFSEYGDFYNHGYGFNPIGGTSGFTGVFDGNNHVIKNLHIESPGLRVGLFNENRGTIRNVGIVNSFISASYPEEASTLSMYAGSIAAKNYGRIENCYNTGSVSVVYSNNHLYTYVGGIAGDNRGTISDCNNQGSVSDKNKNGEASFLGGIAGMNKSSIVKNCYNSGSVSASNSSDDAFAGGITGNNDNGTIENCHNIGSVSALASSSNEFSGGIAATNNSNIKNSYNAGTVTVSNSSAGKVNVGGIVATNDGMINNCYNTVDLSASGLGKYVYVGGIASINNSIIKSCYNLGCLTALVSDPSSVNSLYSYSACAYTGGIAGDNNGSIETCYNIGNLAASSWSMFSNFDIYAYAGGIVGHNGSGTIENCYNTDSVSSVTGPGTEPGVIYASLARNAYSYSGGVAGYNLGGTINTSYSIGDVSAEALATYDKYTYKGGITGFGGTLNNCYSDKTSDELKLSNTYTSFDFESVWTMDGNECYPYAEFKNVNIILDHFYNGSCDTTCNCGFVRASSSDHKYIHIYDTINHFDKCTICENIINAKPHQFVNACDASCDCGYERTITHSYDNACDTNCNECGLEREVPDHVYDNSCDTDCNLCNELRTITHSYKNACDTTCDICGQIRTVPDHNYTLNSNHTCDICKYSRTPGKPIVESKTNNSVTLVPLDGFEYSKNGLNWQANNVFTNLSADTTYTFYQRVKASSNALASEISEGLAITFKSAQTAPYAPIISSFTDTMVTLVAITNGEYSTDGANWQTSNVFTGLSSGTKYTFYQRYAETDTHEASNIITGTSVTTDKSKQTLIPNTPTVQSFTASSITLTPIDGCEYSKNGTTWQTNNTFYNLSCGTEYTFYQRYKETATTYAGKSSSALKAQTDKGTQTKPSAPTLSSKTYNSVTLTAISGYEYSRDGINWQNSNVFTGLTAETNYLFYRRRAETNTHYASESSASITVKTDDAPICVIDPTLHIYDNDCDKTCNLCGSMRNVQEHKYSNTCDTTCNECQEVRVVGPHKYDNACDESCNTCGATRSIAHDYAEATCRAPKTCKICGTTSGNKLSHNADAGTITQNATCTATGTMIYKCTLCNEVIKTVAIAMLTHNYDSGKLTKSATCKEAGIKTYTCSVCKETKTETIEKSATHTYSNNCDSSCNVCGATRSITHNYATATCTKPKTCKVCGATSGKALGHTYTNSCDKSCNRCKATRSIKHTYTNTCDTTCNICKATRSIKHSYKTTTTKATLKKNGSVVKKCTVCGIVASKTTIKYVKSIKLSATSYTYNGKVKTPTVTVKDSSGKTLKKNTDYTVSYAKGRKKVGTYKVTIKFKGNYSGTKTLTFKINPAKTNVSKLTAGKKSITVNITKKSTQVTGYQIQYSTSKEFTNAKTKTIKSCKTTKYTLKGLSAKKTYYVRVRTYKTVGDVKYYSGWSTYKHVKTK